MSAVIEEGQRTVVGDKMLGKKGIGVAKTLLKQTPKTSSTDFRAGTGESFDRALGIKLFRLIDLRFDSHPVAHRGDFAERNATLNHAERTRIHADENHSLAASSVAAQIAFVRLPSVG